ncbi:aminopeptidase [Sphingomonas sp. Leaf412]|uniref:M28 family peptidase n=1 Tax=Sphingomonas sp. Leaf412 TaxID=1736370 RepID=UPI0007014F02|nr:M28 family peptidase [Sphingomonas sp. Leaf412]KQT34894.1 aminopeptidase [Sphingomonas sp. Leaf412]
MRSFLRFALLAAVPVVAAAQSAPPPPPPAPAPAPVSKPAAVDPFAPLPPDQAAMRAHVLFLASDALRGREAGTHDYDVAAQYVAAQFYAAGLRPAGDAGAYLQRVPLVTYRAADKGKLRWKPARGRAKALKFGTDYVPLADARAATTTLDAPVVFVGHGVSAPQFGHDDYAGVDVRGKIVAFAGGAPDLGNGEVQASFTRDARLREAQRRGAVGAVGIDLAGGRGPGFAALAKRWDRPAMTWAAPDGTGGGPAARGVPMVAMLSADGAAKLFGADWAGIAAAAREPKPAFRGVAAAGRLSVATATAFAAATSSNVVGLLPGTDPALKEEVVVLSAHLDHIGVDPSGEGDRINNGALDNAIGIASLIEEAKRFAASGKPPRRSILFLAVTAEEKGLIGADYFAAHPTVALDRIVADVNLDMPVLLYRFEDMTVFGAERSTLGPIVRRAVRSAGVDLTPDKDPDQAFFVRSDHYRFVERGIPSVFLWPGQKGAGGKAFQDFLKTCYHRPCDEVTQPILWDQGVRFVDVNYRIAREIADADRRPVWNKGDYFGTLYGGPMAK